MKQLYLIWICFFTSMTPPISQAQVCKETFKGVLANQSITMCFYTNDSNELKGEYFYGEGEGGVLYFSGTATLQKNGSYLQELEEKNGRGKITGRFEGTRKEGIMEGVWHSPDGKMYKYRLSLQK